VTAIVSKGVLSGVDGSSSYFGTSVASSVDSYFSGSDYAALYRSQANVRMVVDFLARNIAQVALHVYRRVSDTDRVRLTEGPLAAMLARPSPRLSAYRAKAALVSDLSIYGVGYWLKVGTPAEPGLARLAPWRVTPLGGNTTAPVAFSFGDEDGSRVILAPQRLVYFRFFNPLSERIGLSPLESLRQMLAEEAAASDYRARYWAQGAKVSGFIERPKDAPKWSKDARDRFRSDWQARYTGEGMEVGGTPILEDGMTYKAGAFSARDSQYLEARKLAREEVAAAYFIPPPMIGVLDNANYANTKQFHQQLYQDTLGPWFEMLSQEIELQLVPDFDTSGEVYAEFNIADKLKGSFEEQAAALSLATGGPWMTRAEARGRMNLPELADEAAGELITPMNVSVGGQAAPNAPQPSASSLQGLVIERAVSRLVTSMSSDGLIRRGKRVLAEAEEDLSALDGGAA